ncbi:MAG: hypothetical protein WAZ19_07495 [Anaerolineae bacterium]
MEIVKNSNGKAVKIYGDHSNQPVIIMQDAVDRHFGGDYEKCFRYIKRTASRGLMPRMGSDSNPLTTRIVELAMENEAHGEKKHFYVSLSGANVRRDTGYDFVHGIATQDEDFIYVAGEKIRK